MREGNEELVRHDPGIQSVLIWRKNSAKYVSLMQVIRMVRNARYDAVINLQRHFSTGLITILSGANVRIGFKQNPLSIFFTNSFHHDFPSVSGIHEIERNHNLINHLTDGLAEKPKLYFSESTFKAIEDYFKKIYVCMAPASVWFTKQFPVEKWVELTNAIRPGIKIYLVGGPDDVNVCNQIKIASGHPDIKVLAGILKLDENAALISKAKLIFANDSAPLHMGSATNTPTCAIFCSTLPSFGFGPLSDISITIETKENIACRPCGNHGKSHCPEGHFNCAYSIDIESLKEVVARSVPEIIK